MKKVIAGLVVGLVLVWAGSALARDIQHDTIAFDTSSGTTKIFSSDGVTRMADAVYVELVATSDDVWITRDGSTTPVKDQHIRLEQDLPYAYVMAEGEKIEFTGGGNSVGYLNVVQSPVWLAPY